MNNWGDKQYKVTPVINQTMWLCQKFVFFLMDEWSLDLLLNLDTTLSKRISHLFPLMVEDSKLKRKELMFHSALIHDLQDPRRLICERLEPQLQRSWKKWSSAQRRQNGKRWSRSCENYLTDSIRSTRRSRIMNLGTGSVKSITALF